MSVMTYPLEDLQDPLFEEVGLLAREPLPPPGREPTPSERTVQGMKGSYLTDDLKKRDTPLTPDWLKIKLRNKIPIFVYDGLRPGGRFHKLLSDCETFGEGYTSFKHYTMRSVGGNFPAVCVAKNNQDDVKGKIYGDVFVVKPDRILELDLFLGHMYRFERRDTWVFLVDQSYKTKGGQQYPSIKCMMYVAIPKWIDQTSSSLCHAKTGTGKLDKYYVWSDMNGNMNETQLQHMQNVWAKFGVSRPDFGGRIGPLESKGILTA